MQAPALICILEGRAGKCLLSNADFSKMFFDRPMLGRTPREVAPELEGQGFFEMLESVYDSGEPVYRNEFPGYADWNDNGNPFEKYFNFVYTPYRVADKISGVMIFGIDVTTQVLANQKLQQSEKQFKELANFMPQIVWTASADGRVDYFNRNWYRFIQKNSSNEFINWTEIVHPDDLDLCISTWNHCVETGTPYEIENRFIDTTLPEGFRWFLVRGLPLKDEAGIITKWLGTCTDVHDTKKENKRLEEEVSKRTAELEKLANDLRQSNEDLEQFAAIASHDLKAPLRKITTYISAVSYRHAENVNKDVHSYLKKIENTAYEMTMLVENLLQFSKVSSNKISFQKVDLKQIIREAMNALEVVITESKGEIILPASMPEIEGEATQLNRLFVNLISNSLKFKKPGSAPVLNIQSGIASQEIVQFNELNPTRKYIEISVQDNGIGFDTKNATEIFELFRRLNPVKEYEGSGMGLAISKRIVENHQGKIYATSKRGEGAIFTILLPVKINL